MKTPFVPRRGKPRHHNFVPPGFVPLIEALQHVGRTRFGEAWSNLEWNARSREQIAEDAAAARRYAEMEESLKSAAGTTPVSPLVAAVSGFLRPAHPVRNDQFRDEESEIAAAGRAVEIWSEVSRWLFSRQLATVGIADSGTPHSISHTLWASSDAPHTVYAGTINCPVGSFPDGDSTTVWVFVETRSLDKALQRPSKAISRSPVSRASLRKWFLEYIAECVSDERQPSRQDDLKAARSHFPTVSSTEIRNLRSQLAPPSWQKAGRRPVAKAKSG